MVFQQPKTFGCEVVLNFFFFFCIGTWLLLSLIYIILCELVILRLFATVSVQCESLQICLLI